MFKKEYTAFSPFCQTENEEKSFFYGFSWRFCNYNAEKLDGSALQCGMSEMGTNGKNEKKWAQYMLCYAV